MQPLSDLIQPISRFVARMNLADAAAAEASLEANFPAKGTATQDLIAAAEAALAAGTICQRGEGDMTFSRVHKPEADAGGCSVDAVHMKDVKGPPHTHDKGEVCLCIPQDGAPRFEGRQATWMVLAPGTRHEPTVEGGRMLILYWWPEGAVTWG